MKTEIKIDCECGAEILKVEYWPEDNTYCLVNFRYSPLRFSLKRRLRFLFTGIVEYNEIICGEKQIHELQEFFKQTQLNNQ